MTCMIRFLTFSLIISSVIPTVLCFYMTSIGIQIARTQIVKHAVDSEQTIALREAMSDCEQSKTGLNDEITSNDSTEELVDEDLYLEKNIELNSEYGQQETDPDHEDKLQEQGAVPETNTNV